MYTNQGKAPGLHNLQAVASVLLRDYVEGVAVMLNERFGFRIAERFLPLRGPDIFKWECKGQSEQQMRKHDITIYRLRVPKEKLASIPENERNFFFMLAHIGNELSILQKLLWFASNSRRGDGTIQDTVQTMQALFIGRLLVGKVKEAWEFVRTVLLSSPLGKIYTPLLSNEATEALNTLKEYFGKPNLIDHIRNDFVFHYSSKGWSERLTSVFEKIEDAEVQFFISHSRANSHWHGADVLVNYAILEAIEPDDPSKAMDRLIGESTEVAGWLTDFIDETLVTVAERHMGAEYVREHLTSETIPAPPHPSKVGIPFFVRVPKKHD